MWFVMMSVAVLVVGTSGIPCEEARMKCAYRTGCGTALHNYLVGCSVVLQGPHPTYCPEVCQYSLVALTSTEEGTALTTCDCSDDYCEDQKQRSEICRPQVTKILNSPVVPCRVAHAICVADASCSAALEYYNQYCKAMFHGKKCTAKCHNSIKILRRQEKAEKLKTCKCDGYNSYECTDIQRNMEKLCFRKHSRRHNATSIPTQTNYITRVTTSGDRTIQVTLTLLTLILVPLLIT
ncbi:growth arrest-specific protein 1-like [Cylas formicarius]|uniref:growth arrest-specific protein 1-like n=1 Tax=Cylas formicarius TaxID=197179 RepID=UPI002958B071|nr:growth arrest-specific protein 1-like [Cylas formicarius]XP_060522975.1 growth arrest-specific protein 1-like [Cylas formicarius]